ncbi:MAG: hypothetical protein ABFD89_00925 [Bryobacteraceae bacterium]
MSDSRAVWTTASERKYLRDLAERNKLWIIDGWLQGASMRSDWGQMDRDELTKYAKELLGRE